MSERVRYARLGVFVLASALLAAGAVVFFGAGDLFRAKYPVEMYIDESVQGLDPGAAVKFRGVEVGRVEELGFVRSKYGVADARVRVVLVFMPKDAATLGRGEPVQVFQDYVRKGLRGRLASAGLTGGMYLELDMLDPDKHPPPEIPWVPEHPVLPAVASTGTRLLANAESLLVRLERVKIDELVLRLMALVEDVSKAITPATEDARALLAAVRKELLVELKGTLAAVTKLVEEDLAPAVKEIRGAAAKAGPALEKTDAALGKLDVLLSRADRAVAANGVQAEEAMDNLRVAAQDLRDLMATLKRYPATAVLGEAPPKPKAVSK